MHWVLPPLEAIEVMSSALFAVGKAAEDLRPVNEATEVASFGVVRGVTATDESIEEAILS